jgi:hypothetical protein
MEPITWLIGSTSTIALDNIYRAQCWLKPYARQLVSAANVSTAILFPLRRRGSEADHQNIVALTPVAANCGWRDFAAQRLRKINPELSFRHLETRNG